MANVVKTPSRSRSRSRSTPRTPMRSRSRSRSRSARRTPRVRQGRTVRRHLFANSPNPNLQGGKRHHKTRKNRH